MELHDRVALVTGANRGLGARFVAELLAAGVRHVHATARDTGSVAPGVRADPRVTVHPLDVTDQASVDALMSATQDVGVLVNNAGTLHFGGPLDGDLDGARADWEVNYAGLLRVSRAFAPVLEANRPAAIVNVLTLIALAPVPPMAGYSASKAAAHSATQALRAELRGRGVHVLGAYPGGIDTDMLAGVDAVKADPQVVAARIVAALAGDREIVFPDGASAAAGDAYLADPLRLEKLLAG